MPKDAKSKNEKKHFFKDFKAELKKVIWPTPKQLVNNTVAVITVVLITAVIVLVLDLVFEKMNTFGINRIKQAVESKNEIVNEVVVDNETEESSDDLATEVTESEETENNENENSEAE